MMRDMRFLHTTVYTTQAQIHTRNSHRRSSPTTGAGFPQVLVSPKLYIRLGCAHCRRPRKEILRKGQSMIEKRPCGFCPMIARERMKPTRILLSRPHATSKTISSILHRSGSVVYQRSGFFVFMIPSPNLEH